MPDTPKELVALIVGELEKEDGALGQMVRLHVDQRLDQLMPYRDLERRVAQIIHTRWADERRLLFIAGAEWAQQFIPEMPRGFYDQAEKAAAEALKH